MDVIQHPTNIDYNVIVLDEDVSDEEMVRFADSSADNLRFVMDSECNMVLIAPKAVAEWLMKLINVHGGRR